MVKHAHLLLGRVSNNMVTLLHIHTLVLLGENNLTVLVDASKNGIITSNWHVCNSGSVMVKCLLTAAGHCNAVLVPGIWSHACKYVAGCEEFLSYHWYVTSVGWVAKIWSDLHRSRCDVMLMLMQCRKEIESLDLTPSHDASLGRRVYPGGQKSGQIFALKYFCPIKYQ